jgi:hypothetical protein
LFNGYFQESISAIRHFAVVPDLSGLHIGVAVDSLFCKAFVLDLTRVMLNLFSTLLGIH